MCVTAAAYIAFHGALTLSGDPRPNQKSRREFALDFIFAETVNHVVASANGDGHHAERRILAR
jgi:hypothetical protein